jgi:carbamoyltransferase
MQVLGISCYYHDAAAALVRDGQVVAAAAEERFTRKKHDSDFPEQAIGFCLRRGGVAPSDIDYVSFYEKPIRKFDRLLQMSLARFPRSYSLFRQAIPLWLKDRLWIERRIRKRFGEGPHILFTTHHESHAASAFLVSPFEEAAILTMDGVGEWTTTSCGVGRGRDVQLERAIHFPHSLGLFYSAVTAYLGFEVNDGEWKVMGLAPYGEPRYVDRMRRLFKEGEEGSFALDMRYFTHDSSSHRMFNSAFAELLGHPARLPESEIDSFYRDVARSAQAVLEERITAIALGLYRRYGLTDLCIAGGVGLNGVANWKILQETPFKRIFVQPAAGDDGGALGTALYVYHTLLGRSRGSPMRDACLGPDFSDEEIGLFLDREGVSYRRVDRETLLEETAARIASGNVVGWFQGRMEFGPRALGARSILADPRNPEMKRIINEKIKFREWFRPFAPSVLQEEAHKIFEMPEGMEAPFMVLVMSVRPEWRGRLPAITHEDGTGRVQTVARDRHPLYYDLIRAFHRKSGVPVLVNTSFNVRGEPIVCTPEDAYRCFRNSGIDSLAMGHFLIDKPGRSL